MLPSVKVIEFKSEYRKGKTVDWVCYAPRHAAMTSQTWDRVDRLRPPEELKRDNRGLKARHMSAVWSAIEPAYNAWKAGHEMPETGIPLGAWPGVTKEQAEVLRIAGMRSVEDVAAMTDGQIPGVKMPGVRELRKQAQMFLESRESSQTAERMATLEEQNAALSARLEEAMSMLQENAERQAEKPKRGRPPKARPENEAQAE